MMKVKLIAYGIARDIVKSRNLEVELEGSTITELRKVLLRRYPDFEKLKSLSFAVGDEYRDDNHVLKNGDEVAVIPPVSGG